MIKITGKEIFSACLDKDRKVWLQNKDTRNLKHSRIKMSFQEKIALKKEQEV